MKQAVHIFLKDVQRLWLQIALLMVAIGYFAWLDINLSPFPNNSGNVIIEFIVTAMVWFLIARTVHEEALPGENQFWLTRPYDRGSLLGAKILMVLCVVAAPLFVADCVILSVQSLGTVSNLGGLGLKQLLTGAWLILPPLAVASVTRAITEDILVWLVMLAVATFSYFPRNGAVNEFQTSKEYEFAFALLLLALALWHQYFRRGAIVSRALIVAAVLLPALPIPESAALAVAQLQNDSAASEVVLTARPGTIAEQRMTVYAGYLHCAPVAISVKGLHDDWRLVVLNQKDTFESGGKTWSRGWQPENGAGWEPFNPGATVGHLNACMNSEGLAPLGSGNPITVHSSLVLEVLARDAVKTIRAQWEPFDVPDVGRCQFQRYLHSENYVLTCSNPLKYPPQGNVVIGTDGAWGPAISNHQFSFAPLNLLPGMSPVYKWTTLAMDSQIRKAVAAREPIEFRSDSRIAVIEREVTVKDVRFVE